MKQIVMLFFILMLFAGCSSQNSEELTRIDVQKVNRQGDYEDITILMDGDYQETSYFIKNDLQQTLSTYLDVLHIAKFIVILAVLFVLTFVFESMVTAS